jgi:murein DD-endopeptidase MepM/ murein hydrolase activator NlpD
MRRVAEPVRSLSWSRLALTAATAVSLVSCSSDSSRFANDSLFSSRSAPAGEVTGAVSRKPSSSVQSSPLPPPTGSVSAPQTRPASGAAAVTSTAGGSRGSASYQGPASQEITGTVPQRIAQPAAQPGWTWEGGTPITVGQGDTAQTLSKRYGVPADAIVQSNNLASASAIKPGQRLVIPRYEAQLTTGSVTAPRQVASAPPAISAPATGGQHVHVVAPGETLSKVSRTYKKSLSDIAKANNIAAHTQVKVGDRLIIPGVRAQQAAAPVPPAPVAQQKMAAAPAVSTARSITPAADNPVPEAKPVSTAAALPTFRWPVRGRVINGFGPKTTGTQNDGINVAVPEGTPVKAAEDGVVAYAGNELKSYGNLVLVRHANGYVTAYAHASEILVKRDEPIKRGQVIAKSGQTGNVTAPQLHFEIRKGSSPVDPMPYLDKGGNT